VTNPASPRVRYITQPVITVAYVGADGPSFTG
jgi:hypothetical protein